jgi:hypothetical protein
MNQPCCYIGPGDNDLCKKDAEWSIYRDSKQESGENYTYSCREHVGQMLWDDAPNRVFPHLVGAVASVAGS